MAALVGKSPLPPALPELPPSQEASARGVLLLSARSRGRRLGLRGVAFGPRLLLVLSPSARVLRAAAAASVLRAGRCRAP